MTCTRERNKVIGYHYTSARLYEKIKIEGLKPYPMNLSKCDEIINGIWLWVKPLDAQSELGTILYQLSIKHEFCIVKLEVDYDGYSLYEPGILGEKKFYHGGVIGSWNYHNNEPACVVLEPILPEKIKLIREYNLLSLVL